MRQELKVSTMKRTVTASPLLLIAVLCLGQTSQPEKETLSADEVLKSYAQRVHAEVLPRANELRHEEIIQLTGNIAAEVLAPHRNLLFEKSKAEIAELPKLAVDLSSGWDTVAEVDGGVIDSGFGSELSRSTSQPATEPVNKDAILLLYFWNAKTAAYTIRTQMLVRHSGPKEYGQRAMIEALARPLVYAVNADPQAPVIAIETGADVFVVSLKHTDKGYYLDEKVQWLKRKGGTSRPAGADRVDPKQKVAADYFEALITADVKKTNELVAVPYSMDRKRILTTREQVEDMHQQIADRKGKRDIPQYTIELTDQAPELDKAQFPKYVVYRITVTTPGRERKENIDIYVIDSDLPKVIGFSD